MPQVDMASDNEAADSGQPFPGTGSSHQPEFKFGGDDQEEEKKEGGLMIDEEPSERHQSEEAQLSLPKAGPGASSSSGSCLYIDENDPLKEHKIQKFYDKIEKK